MLRSENFLEDHSPPDLLRCELPLFSSGNGFPGNLDGSVPGLVSGFGGASVVPKIARGDRPSAFQKSEASRGGSDVGADSNGT
jgi:hypothetical protein